VAGYAVEDLSADPTDGDDDDETGDGEGGRSIVRVSVEARSRAAACRKPRLSDSEWLDRAVRRMVAADLAIRSESTRAYSVSDAVDDLGLRSQTALDAAHAEDVRF